MKKFLISILVLFPLMLSAHPGHGVGNGNEALHYLVSPYHMGLALFFVVLVFVLVKASPKRNLG